MKLQIQCALIMLAIAGSMRCDPVAQLDPSSTTTFYDNRIYSLNWCDCNYLAVGGQWQDDDFPGSIGIFKFDQSTQLLSPVITTSFFFLTNTVKWCPASSCSYLAVGGFDVNNVGQIQIYRFEQSPTPTLITIPGANQQLGGLAYSIDWCPSCLYLAAGGYDNNGGIIQLYHFDGVNLTATFNPATPVGMQINSLKWCGNCQYLAAIDNTSTLHIYSFNSQTGLIPLVSYTTTSIYSSIDWCGDCGYLAASGITNNVLGIIDIYKFDSSSTPSLHIVATTKIQSPYESTIVSIAWCQECDNLAAIGARIDLHFNETDFVQLYHFDTTTQTLSFAQEYPLTFAVNYQAAHVSWCTDCSYLGVGGFRNNGIIQLFKSEFLVPPIPTVMAQQICHRFPTQIDISNQLCWDAVEGAVAYNVYADAALSIKLATVTEPPLCYLQHQICKGKQVTYYVTAVNVYNRESDPAVVTI